MIFFQIFAGLKYIFSRFFSLYCIYHTESQIGNYIVVAVGISLQQIVWPCLRWHGRNLPGISAFGLAVCLLGPHTQTDILSTFSNLFCLKVW